MKSIRKSAMLAVTVAMGLGLAACDGKKENAEEAAAQNVRASGEASADAMENQADAVRASGGSEVKADAMEDKADVKRNAADAKADAMEDKADAKDTTPE